MTITDHGIPVTTSRQWTTALVPNAAETGWNYIVSAWTGVDPQPVEWVVLKDLTGAPSQVIFETATHDYPNSNIQYYNQLRSANGRVWFPCFGPSLNYYDPDAEEIVELGHFVETPPVDPNDSTTFYSAIFDTAGTLYLGTQESENRAACIVSVDPDTAAITELGYVGDGAASYTTYAYYLAPDTGTASKWIYVAYGKDPWQLWAINLTPGPSYGDTTKLYDVVGPVGNIAFENIAGKGWIATMDTNYGDPSNVRVVRWCIDGALESYTVGVDPSSPRSVTPYSNPTVSPPEIDIDGGVGFVGWRDGSVGPYEPVNYTVTNTTPVQIRALVDSNDGILGHADGYLGLFDSDAPGYASLSWFGPWPGGMERGPHLNVDGIVYMSGYPNGATYAYDPDELWQNTVNPLLLGYVGGLLNAGIKYSDHMAWAPNAGDDGRIIIAGSREREGVGMGVGSWDRDTGALDGTFSEAGMGAVVPDGLVVCDGIDRIVVSTHNLSGTGTAPLMVFDYSFNLIDALAPIAEAALGPIFETSTPNAITGILQGDDGIRLWQYNVQTETLIDDVEVPGIEGTLDLYLTRLAGTSHVYVTVSDQLVVVDIDTLTAEIVGDISTVQPIRAMAFAADGSTLFFSGGMNDGIAGAQIFSTAIGDVIAADEFGLEIEFEDLTFSNDGDIAISAGAFELQLAATAASFVALGASDARIGSPSIELQNDEGAPIYFAQPLYPSGEGLVRLACADDAVSCAVIGLVAAASVDHAASGAVKVEGPITATTAQWDAVCGTSGGLTFGTTYYLHPTTPGRLTATRPSQIGQRVLRVIHALSSTRALILIDTPSPITA